MTEHERDRELEALDLVLMGVEAGLTRLPDSSVWSVCLHEFRTVLGAQVVATVRQHHEDSGADGPEG